MYDLWRSDNIFGQIGERQDLAFLGWIIFRRSSLLRGATTFTVTTLDITTLSITTLGITTFSMTTLDVKASSVLCQISKLCRSNFILILRSILLSVILLIVGAPKFWANSTKKVFNYLIFN
jgi:hypothetical protein